MNLKPTKPEHHFWLLKSEPTTFSLDDLRACPTQTEPWDGVRNYQARNFLRAMNVGDQAFFYHSRTRQPAIVGVVEIVKTAYPDPLQFSPESYHFDPKSSAENPRWSAVDVKFVRAFSQPITLETLKSTFAGRDFLLIQRGNRLSVMPVAMDIWQEILAMTEGES